MSYLYFYMEIQKHIVARKELYAELLEFIEGDFLNYGIDTNIKTNTNELKEFLYVITRISRNHHRDPNFFNKIELILSYLENDIKQKYSNNEIFEIFQKDKRILHYLIKRKIIKIDGNITKKLLKPQDEDENKQKSKINNEYYFYPEIKEFIDEKELQQIEKMLENKYSKDIKYLYEKREEGENDNYICQLIRQDSVEEFIAHINQTNTSLKSKIKLSIFETNSFLFDKNPSLIEYAAFFGSIQIFQFLVLNYVKLMPSLWLYAIHGKNAEIIHLLENNHIEPEDVTYAECFKESIKCHHNDIADYFKNNILNESLLNNKNNGEEPAIEKEKLYCYHYHNYHFFTENIEENHVYYFCKYDYINIVNLLIRSEEIRINTYRIPKRYF